MQHETNIKVAETNPDPDQPRKNFAEAELLQLGQSMKLYGQLVPVIVFIMGAIKVLLDGERRWRAAQLVGITELKAIVLPERPSTAELAILRASIDVHRASLTPMERSNLLARIKAEQGWGVSELAQRLAMKQPVVSKSLAYQRLVPALQELLHTGKLDLERAFIISQQDGEQAQLALANGAASVSRDQPRAKARSNGHEMQPKAKRAVFVLPGGVSVVLQGREVTLAEAIDCLAGGLKELKKALGQHLDIDTVQRVLRDRAKVAS